MAVERESAVQARCVRVLERQIGAIVIRTNAGQWEVNGHFIQGAARGTSDLTVCLPNGVFCAIEVKRPGEKPRADQLAYLASIEARGGVGLWVDDPDTIRPELVRRFGSPTVAAWEAAACVAHDQRQAQLAQQRLAPHNRARQVERRARARDVDGAGELF